MSPAHSREAIHTVDDDRVSAASYALDGDRVAAKARDEAIPLFGVGGAAGDGCNRDEEKRQGLKRSSKNHVRLLASDLTEMPEQRCNPGTNLHRLYTRLTVKSPESEA
jgi:hypothetical protein